MRQPRHLPSPAEPGRLFLVSVFILGLAAADPSGRKLNRHEDFILFTGDQTPSLIGAETRDLHLFACGPSGRRPIPFQVDKRDAEGRYVFANEKGRAPLRDGAKLDANDELVFMVKDAGKQCPEAGVMESAARGVEIELTDPLDGGRAWVYLLDRPGAKPPETADYVKYRIENGEEYIKTDQYEIGMKLGASYYDFLRIRRPDGGFSPDLLDRTKVGIRARLLNGAIPIHIPEQEIKSVILGVIDGPVRVIRDELDLVKLKSIGLDWETEAYYTYYFNGHLSPMDAAIPFNLHKLFLDVSFYWAMDFNESMLGSSFRNSSNPRGVVLDGKPDPDLETKSDNSTFMVTGPQGGIMDALVFDATLKELSLIRGTLVREDLAHPDPPEDHPGQLLVGYWVRAANRLTKGVYHWRLFHYYPYPFSERKVQEVLNISEHPVSITVRPLDPSSQVVP